MKRALLIIAGVLLGVVLVGAQVHPRFEMLLREVPEADRTTVSHFEVWHDKESGQEFTCVVPVSTLVSADKISCFPTGRNWK
jgi:hypothetical protein